MPKSQFAVFRPACKVRFQIRFETFDKKPLPPAAAVAPSPQGAEAFGPGTPGLLSSFEAVGFDVIPYNCSVEKNSYRKADEARVTVPLRQLPFDPRIIRAATIQVFGGTFLSPEYAEAMGPVGAKGLLLPDVVPDGRAEEGTSNEIFRGFVDDWEMMLEGHDTLSVTARDLTGPLLDAEISENFLRDLPHGLPLDQVIQLLLTGDGAPTRELSRRFGVPGFRGLVVVNETGEALPAIREVRSPQWLDSKKTVKKGRKTRPAQAQNQSYWDAITDLCVSSGFIVYMRPGTKPVDIPGLGVVLPASEIVISNPRTYYQEGRDAADSIDFSNVRTFTYGLNTNSIQIRRKLGGVVVPTIEVRANRVEDGKQLIARFPPVNKAKVNKPAPSGQGDREEIKTFILRDVGGPNAQQALDSAARSIYEQLGRGEMEVEIRTRHMGAYIEHLSDGNAADMFRLNPGDTIRVEVATSDVDQQRVAAHTLFTSSSRHARIDSMFRSGIPADVASRAATAMENRFIQNEFRVQSINLSWASGSSGGGWEFQVQAVNYLDVRDSIEAIEGLVP